MNRAVRRLAPVVVGGVGGGGTRVVSQILDALGFELGPVSVPSLDNVLFTTFFTIPAVARAPRDFSELDAFLRERQSWWDIFTKATTREPLTSSELLQVETLVETTLAPPLSNSARLSEGRKADLLGRIRQALEYCRRTAGAPAIEDGRWGWKEPNTSVFLPQIGKRFPRMKYVHVMRHGLDMAYSSNVNQVVNWGRLFDIQTKQPPDPESCLEFWVRTNERTIAFGREALKNNFTVLRFDDLVLQPLSSIPVLCDFLEVTIDRETLLRLAAIPTVPRSLGRYKERELARLDPRLVARVRALGFETQA